MKKMKRLAALFLAVVMVMAMGMTVMAADITIKGAVKGATYTAYKIFNVTTTTVNGEEKAAYTRDTALPAGYEAVFSEAHAEGGKYYYSLKDQVTEAQLVRYLKSNAATIKIGDPKLVTVPADNTTATVTITGLEDGYYYIHSSVNNGAAAMLRAVDGNITITEKNTQPGWGAGGKESVKVDENGDVVYDQDGKPVVETFYAVGETVHYVVTYENAQNFISTTTNGETTTTKIYQYVVEDNMPTGIELDTGSLNVTVNGEEPTEAYIVKTLTTGGFEITIPWAATHEDITTPEDFYYEDVPATIVVTYEAEVKSNVTPGQAINNRAKVDYNDTKLDPGKDNNIYTGSLQVQKFDSTNIEGVPTEDQIADATKLSSAKFVIIDTETVGTTTQYLKYTEADGYSWTKDATDDVVELTTAAETGLSEIVAGLGEDTYYLLETEAPAGYNLMTTTTPVTIGDSTNTKDLVKTQPIGNKAGTVLPSTGGIGTTIFYVIGGILVLGAGVLLITKKRMSARD